jgi:hypothetical protein
VKIIGATQKGYAQFHTTDATVRVDLPDTKTWHTATMKVYGPAGITSAPLFSKLMDATAAGVFTANFKHPTDANFQLPKYTTCTLLVELYHMYSSGPVTGYSSYTDTLKVNGITPLAGTPLSYITRRDAAVALDFGVNKWDVLVCNLVQANAKTTATVNYIINATSAQKTALNTKAAEFCKAKAIKHAATMDSFCPPTINNSSAQYAPWKSTINIASSGIGYSASVYNVPVESAKLASFLTTVAALAKTETVTYPEGSVTATTTTFQSKLY